MRDLYRHLCSRRVLTGYIGLTINSESFRRGPSWMSCRPIQNFDAKKLWEMLFSVVHSNEDFNVDEPMTIRCGVVESILRRGCVQLTEATYKKQSILTISNKDNVCPPRSLAPAYAYVVRGEMRSSTLHDYWNTILQSGSTEQKKAALELVRMAKVSVPTTGCV